ncbi:hypothetical protein BH24GEM2_BH24GEM2_00640 [soil metagenome]|jgi:hypothetical protein
MNKPTMEPIVSQLKEIIAPERVPVHAGAAPDPVQPHTPQFPEWDLLPPSPVLNRRRRTP